MKDTWTQKMERCEEDTNSRGERECLPRALLCFVAPIFHAILSNDLFIIDHSKGYAFPVLKAIKYSCNINFSFISKV